jgi:hypothetical protein
MIFLKISLMTITQHALLYNFHTSNLAFEEIFFLKFLSLQPLLVLAFFAASDGIVVNKNLESQIVDIISSTVATEMEFVVNALPVKLIGMNSAMMCNDYINFFAD